MSEWFKEAVLKTAVRQRTVGSIWSSTQEAEEAPLLRA